MSERFYSFMHQNPGNKFHHASYGQIQTSIPRQQQQQQQQQQHLTASDLIHPAICGNSFVRNDASIADFNGNSIISSKDVNGIAAGDGKKSRSSMIDYNNNNSNNSISTFNWYNYDTKKGQAYSSKATSLVNDSSKIGINPLVNAGVCNMVGPAVNTHLVNHHRQQAIGGTASQTYYYVNSLHNLNGYHCNRYMPYNRNWLGNLGQHQPQNHHHVHTAASLNSVTLSYNFPKSIRPIYQVSSSGFATSLTSSTPSTTISQIPSATKPATTATTYPKKPVQNPIQKKILNDSRIGLSNASAINYKTVNSNGLNKSATSNKILGKTLNTITPNTSASNIYPSASYEGNMPAGLDANMNAVTLQITNLDFTMSESTLKNFLHNQLKPITPIVSLTIEGNSYAKVTVPDLNFAKKVVSNLHRKKIGHKRMLVSYTRDSSLTESNTLRCQVAGLLKDVPCHTLPVYKFRELFQSRFKSSISTMELCKMPDICCINTDGNDEKIISLNPELEHSPDCSPLIAGLQHSIPYCATHFKWEQQKGWAEQEIEPLPNVFMTVAEIQSIIYMLMKNHPGDIPILSLVHCIAGQLNIQIVPNENGINLEHLVCCVQGIQIQMNSFGIKTLGYSDMSKDNTNLALGSNDKAILYSKTSTGDPLLQISREVVELIKMSPKCTMKFSCFIPAYHNHFGKQCRVADYGYTKLIELFEALSSVVQIMGDGENRQLTLTHRIQIRRFTTDLMRILRNQKSILLTQLPTVFAQIYNRKFDITDYGVCDIVDILDGLVNSNTVIISSVQNGGDILISIPKRRQTLNEIEKTSVFAAEVVELLRNSRQYTIMFQKFARLYHYHFGHQCRVSDYGFLKLADLMEAIYGIIKVENGDDDDKKISLSHKAARRVFGEQCAELIREMTGSPTSCVQFDNILLMHKKKFGYQIQPQTLGVKTIQQAIECIPYMENCYKADGCYWITCYNEDPAFRNLCYKACKHLLNFELKYYEFSKKQMMNAGGGGSTSNSETKSVPFRKSIDSKQYLTVVEFLNSFNQTFMENLNEATLKAMQHAIEINYNGEIRFVNLTKFMKFLMNIVLLLEQRPFVTLLSIKNHIGHANNTVFEYGYPNLYCLLNAYRDVFNIWPAVTQERSEISLKADTELHLKSANKNKDILNVLKLSCAQQTAPEPIRIVLEDFNNNQTGLLASELTGKTIAATNSMVEVASSSTNVNCIPKTIQAAAVQPPISSPIIQTSFRCTNYESITNMSNCSSNDSIGFYSNNNSKTSSLQTNGLNISISNLSQINKEISSSSSLILNSSLNGSLNNSSCFSEFNNSETIGNKNLIQQQQQQQQQQQKCYDGHGIDYTSFRDNWQHPNIPVYIPKFLSNRKPDNSSINENLNNNTTALQVNHFNNENIPPVLLPCRLLKELSVDTNTSKTTMCKGYYELLQEIKTYPTHESNRVDAPLTKNVTYWMDPVWGKTMKKSDLNPNPMVRQPLTTPYG